MASNAVTVNKPQRKVRSNKGKTRGPRPMTPEREALKLNSILRKIQEKKSLSEAQKRNALINAAHMTANNLRKKYFRTRGSKNAVTVAAPKVRRTRSNKGITRGPRPSTIEKRKLEAAAKEARKATKNAEKAMKIAKKAEETVAKQLNREAARIGRFLNKKGRVTQLKRAIARPAAKATGGARKVRSNKGVKRGPRPDTIEKRQLLAAAKQARKAASENKKLQKAKKAANLEARRLEKVMALIRKRRSLTNDQKAQALVNQATMSAKNLKAKYIVVQKREKKATNAVKNVVQQVVNAVAPAAPKRRRRSANANIAAQNVVTTGRRTRSRK